MSIQERENEKLSASPELHGEWNYRIIASRQIIVKGKNPQVRKVSAMDVLTKTPFPIEVPRDFSLDILEIEKGYFATFKVYTLKNVKDVTAEFVEFFEAIDIDQSIEDFIKAYWLYPNHIKFELTEAEPL